MGDVNLQAIGLVHRRAKDGYRWEGVEPQPYKEDARQLYRAISRQVLFCEPDLNAELRYFEIAAGGFSTLERHQHAHAVLVLRGRGHCLVGEAVRRLEPCDLVSVPAFAWHQFRATLGERLGFLCMVNVERDKPQLPSDDELQHLQSIAHIAAFLRNAPQTAQTAAPGNG
jgi:S-methyl-1-thioxylulose 5-phosphate methylthiotransferase